MSQLLKQTASMKRNPESAAQLIQLQNAARHASFMHANGKLSDAEFADFEAHLFSGYIDALPVEDFSEMMADGRLHDLQAMAGHDGTRDVYDAEDARAVIAKKVSADFLDSLWLEQKIDSKEYANLSREIGTSEKLDDRMADGDFDGAASEMFASRNDTGSKVETDLNAYLAKTYGGEKTDTNPLGYVEHDIVLMPGERQPATDANGVTDLDLLALEDE